MAKGIEHTLKILIENSCSERNWWCPVLPSSFLSECVLCLKLPTFQCARLVGLQPSPPLSHPRMSLVCLFPSKLFTVVQQCEAGPGGTGVQDGPQCEAPQCEAPILFSVVLSYPQCETFFFSSWWSCVSFLEFSGGPKWEALQCEASDLFLGRARL